MTLLQARELSRLSNEHFYVLILGSVYEVWPGGRCVSYDSGLLKHFERYKLRAKACEKQVRKLQEKYGRHLEAMPWSTEGGE